MTTEQSGGQLTIESREGKGTRIEATFLRNHLDRPPLGNFVSTVKVILVGNPDLHLIMHYSAGKHKFEFDSLVIKELLGKDIDFSFPEVYLWLEEYLRQEIEKVRNEREGTE